MLIPSINTLGLQDWTFAQVVDFAQAQHIPYLEIRALRNTVDLLSLPEFSTPSAVREAVGYLRDSGVSLLSLNLGFHLTDDLYGHSATIRRYAALARDLGALYLRFFPGGLPGQPPDLERMALGAGLANHLLADFPVQWVVETHDSLVRSADILDLDRQMEGRLNVLWDIAHTHNTGGEDWATTYAALAPRIRYLHIKDIHRQEGEVHLAPLFTGDLDLRALLAYLQQKPEPVIVSLEWERLWDPTLAPGDEVALDFLRQVRDLPSSGAAR
jgi:sugar phosphate isomerase/epimerase